MRSSVTPALRGVEIAHDKGVALRTSSTGAAAKQRWEPLVLRGAASLYDDCGAGFSNLMQASPWTAAVRLGEDFVELCVAAKTSGIHRLR